MKALPRLSLRFLFWILGGPHLRRAKGGPRLDPASFGRSRGLLAAWSFLVFSLIGLSLGNLPRLANVWGPLAWAACLGAAALAAWAAAAACGLTARRKVAPRETPPLKEWLKALPWLLVGGASVPAAAAAGAVAAGLFWHGLGGLVLRGVERDVVAAGCSFGLPANHPALPEEENAAALFLRAAADPALDEKASRTLLTSFVKDAVAGKDPAAGYARAAKALASRRKALLLARRAASLTKWDWGVDWTVWPPYRVRLPMYGRLVWLAEAQAAQALVSARAGRSAEAVESVRDLLVMARLCAEGETLIGELVGVSQYRRALGVARVVLPRVPADLAWRRWLLYLEPDGFHARWQRALQFEFFGMHEWLGDIGWRETRRLDESGDGFADVIGPGSLGLTFLYWPFFPWDLASGYRAFLDTLQAMALPYPESREALAAAQERARTRLWILGQLSVAPVDRFQRRALAAEAELRLAYAALAARRWRAAHGRWPQNPEALDTFAGRPLLLDDPFAAAPMRLAPRGKALLLYSVGPDGADDGGAPFDADKETGDLSWLVQ